MIQLNRRLLRQEAMNQLKEHVGRTVTVEYAKNGHTSTVEGKLLSVTDFGEISLRIHSGDVEIPFIGKAVAIHSITGDNGTIYENPAIPEDYDMRYTKRIEDLRAKSFGREHAHFSNGIDEQAGPEQIGKTFTGVQWRKLMRAADDVEGRLHRGSTRQAFKELRRLLEE